MKHAAMANFHLPLPGNLYRELKTEAEQRGQPATVVARHRAIAAYAEKWAGSELDLDPQLEAAAVEHLLRHERGRR